jgi:hypothetical protein
VTIIKTDKGTIRANNGTCAKDCGFMIIWNPEGFYPKRQCLLDGSTLRKARRAYERCETCMNAETEYNMMVERELQKSTD